MLIVILRLPGHYCKRLDSTFKLWISAFGCLNNDFMKTLAIIPARGGSKGIPRKNIKLLAGKPLLSWSIEAALTSSMVDRIIVSTDDEEIAGVAIKNGTDVPFYTRLN